MQRLKARLLSTVGFPKLNRNLSNYMLLEKFWSNYGLV